MNKTLRQIQADGTCEKLESHIASIEEVFELTGVRKLDEIGR
jgi:hypothetical protein